MKNGAPFFGNIAVGLYDAAFNQIWRRYRIPTANIEPGLSSSKCIDFQNGYERSTSALISALSGCNYMFFLGSIYGELSSHPLQAVLDDDVAGMIGRFIEGIEVNDEMLAIELITQVGTYPGFYGVEEHTRKWWKNEQYIPKSADLSTPPEWLKEGKKTCIDHAKERMGKILATHKPTPLSPNQEADIDKILEEGRRYYKKLRGTK
jgi:trimethylamine--corrinoid protein Co-methyltransferase